MRRSLWATRKDVLQRLALVAALFVLAFFGAWLGVRGFPSVKGLLVTVFGAITGLWILDPALQYLVDDREEKADGDVA
jgi:hypothetical protein